MLPSNPSATRGLPNNPRLQSRYSTPHRPDSNDARSRPSPRRYANVRPGSNSSSHPADTRSSTETASSSASGRRRGSRASSSSSQASFQDSLQSEGTRPSTSNADDGGVGYTSWLGHYVASATKTLTVNATKAWTAHITTYDGEETPPGQESRLTRAMKAYHIGKARETTDLPTWLFGESERAPLSRNRETGQQVHSGDLVPQIRVSRADRHATLDDRGTSKAAERLRSMRNTRRSDSPRTDPSRASDRPVVASSQYNQTERGGGPRKPTETGHQQRMGLPSGPRRTRVAGT